MLQDAPIAHVATLLSAIIKRQFFNPRQVSCVEPASLSERDAAAIGESVKAVRLGHNMPSKANDELLRTYEALRVAAEQSPWFRSMLEAMLTRLMHGSKSMVARMALGASLSLFDVVTDIFSIYANFVIGQQKVRAASRIAPGCSGM